MSRFNELLEELPASLGGHMLLSASALAVGLVVSLPLGLFVSRRARWAAGALGVAGVLQTIPSLALLALMVPLLGQIGFWPAFITLTLYSILPILANTVVGIRGVDPALLEAADGLGMTRWQRLWLVELPLAAPVILGGVRTATVLVVATATLATPVGQRTLGNFIFQGLNIRDTPMIVFGCVLVAVLAVAFDQFVRLAEVGIRRHRPALVWAGLAGVASLVAVGLYEPLAERLRPDPVVVGSADYTEQHVLGELMKARLREAGFRVDSRTNMAQPLGLEALCAGSIDCWVDYTGIIWTTKVGKPHADRETTLRGVTEYLQTEHGVECLGLLGFQDAYRFAMRRDEAEKRKIKTVSELAPQAQGLRIGDDLFFFNLPEWEAVRKGYGLEFKSMRRFSPELMFPALENGEVDVVTAYTTDGRLLADDYILLDDDKGAFPPYDALLLLSKKAARNGALREALAPLVRNGPIDLQRMREANKMVDIDKKTPKEAAARLLDLVPHVR